MKKLILGFALTLFLGTMTVSANFDNPPKDKEVKKTETTKTTATADKKTCTQATADKKSCCSDKATASAEKGCCKGKAAETASTK